MIVRRYQYIIDHLQYDINADKRLLFYLSFFYITSSSWWCIIVRKEWLLIYRYMCGVRPRNLMRGSFTLQRHHFRFCVLRASVCRCIQRNTNTITEAPHSHHHLVKKHKSINFLFPVCCCSTYHIIHAYYHNQYHQM